MHAHALLCFRRVNFAMEIMKFIKVDKDTCRREREIEMRLNVRQMIYF